MRTSIVVVCYTVASMVPVLGFVTMAAKCRSALGWACFGCALAVYAILMCGFLEYIEKKEENSHVGKD